MKFGLCVLALVAGAFSSPAQNSAPLADAVIVIIRHAEKPETGRDLSPAGLEHARRYSEYFRTFQVDDRPVKFDALFAARDSKHSIRPRLTLEPLARALNLPLDTDYSDKAPDVLAHDLQTHSHGHDILICWHHRAMPDLLRGLGADAATLLPNGEWPEDQFGWVILLRYDHDGRLIPSQCKRITQAG